MKFPAALLAFILLLSACGKKPGETAAPNPPGAPAPKPAAAVRITFQQKAALGRVVVHTPSGTDTTLAAALLNRTDCARLFPAGKTERYYVTLLKGYSAAQFAERGASLTIHEYPEDDGSEPRPSPATLLELNPETGLALLRVRQPGLIDDDAGFHFASSPPETTAGEWPALRFETVVSPPQPTAEGHLFRKRVPRAIPGVFDPIQKSVKFSSPAPEPGGSVEKIDVAVALTGPLQLAGLLAEKPDGAAQFVAIGDLRPKLALPVLKPVAIGFGKLTETSLPFQIETEQLTPGLTVQAPSLLVRPMEPSESIPGPAANGTFAALQTDLIIRLRSRAPNVFSHFMPVDVPEGSQKRFLMQLGWSQDGLGDASIFGQPFAVTVKRTGPEPEFIVDGISSRNVPAPAAQISAGTVALDGTVREIIPLAGGREVLFQFEGAPYWKRFSMARNAWLPLPPCDLSQASFAGNLTHLYLLERATFAAKKFALADLQLAASIKLPSDRTYLAMVAGANSANAPIHLVAADGAFSLDPATLAYRNFPRASNPSGRRAQRTVFSGTETFRPRGDGLSIEVRLPGKGSPRGLAYAGDVTGLNSFRSDLDAHAGNGVTAHFAIPDRYGWFSSAVYPGGAWKTFSLPRPGSLVPNSQRWLLPTSPVIVRVLPADDRAIPARPARLACYAYFATAPFFEYDDPRLADLLLLPENADRTWFALDPYSLQFGCLDGARKTWSVRKITPSPDQKVPVLLNWPETSLVAGAAFQFQPVLLGSGTCTATVRGSSSSISASSSGGKISFQVPPDELAAQLLLELKLAPADPAAPAFSIPLDLPAFPKPFATAAPVLQAGMGDYGLSLKSIDGPKGLRKALSTVFHYSPAPIVDVRGPVNGHLAIFTADQRIEFYSLQARKIVGGIESAKDGQYYVSGDSLLEYSPSRRTIGRLHVPDGRRTASMNFPGDITLHALNVAPAQGAPVTMLLEKRTAVGKEQVGDFTVTTWDGTSSFFVVSSDTLRSGAWAQPRIISTPSNPYSFWDASSNLKGSDTMPKQMVGAQHGQFFLLPDGFMSLNSVYSYGARFPEPRSNNDFYTSPYAPLGSLSGMLATNGQGVLKAGVFSNHPNLMSGYPCIRSTCGRYLICALGDRRVLEVRAIENNQKLFQMTRVLNYFYDTNDAPDAEDPMAKFFGEIGVLIVYRPKGHILQIVDLDVGKLAQELNPTSFHVVSQPPPVLGQGAVLDYQVRVNHPAVVAKVELRTPVPGAEVSPQGRLRYAAPAVTTPTRVNFCLQLHSTAGEVVLQDFSVIVMPTLPPPQAAPPPKPIPPKPAAI